jgi:hypothetical protein
LPRPRATTIPSPASNVRLAAAIPSLFQRCMYSLILKGLLEQVFQSLEHLGDVGKCRFALHHHGHLDCLQNLFLFASCAGFKAALHL